VRKRNVLSCWRNVSSDGEALIVGGRLFHVLAAATGRRGRRVSCAELMKQPVTLCWSSGGDDYRRHRRHGVDCQQGTTELCHEGRQRNARTHSRNRTLSVTHNQWSSQSNGLMCSDHVAEKISWVAAFSTDCNLSKRCPEMPARTELQ